MVVAEAVATGVRLTVGAIVPVIEAEGLGVAVALPDGRTVGVMMPGGAHRRNSTSSRYIALVAPSPSLYTPKWSQTVSPA